MPEIPSPLIDLLSAESFTAEHLPDAVNFCVYETAFPDKIRAAFPDNTIRLTIYGLNDSTLEAGLALKKLEAAGYQNVKVLAGGLEGWKASGKAIEKGAATVSQSVAGRYEVDQAASVAEWVGRNLFNRHAGTVQLGAGTIDFRNGLLVDGHLVVDMTTLRCTDIADPALNAHLVAHLKSDDFFSTEKYPNAEFNILTATVRDGVNPDEPNYRIRGDFTLRGVTQPLDLSAVVARKPGGAFTAQARLDIDRTLWGAIYGSAKFFGGLGQHLVNDVVHVYLKVVTKEYPVAH
ncbi:MAG: YceI family protein [Verrucomicrobia bacterium]|nr:YceI family protein [Verrucomicrobiota bacterium]